MGKKHNKQQSNIKTLKAGEIPDHIKKLLGDKPSEETTAIEGRLRDFVQMQKEFHETVYHVAVLGAELQAMIGEIGNKPEERTMKWNGMIIPDGVLKP